MGLEDTIKEESRYHEIFVPFPKIYRLGGQEALKEFQRKDDESCNLVVIPYDFIKDLEKDASQSSFGGSQEVLDYLVKLKEHKSDGEVDIYSPLQGLDIAIIHKRFAEEDADDYYKKLDNFLREKFDHKEKDKTTFVTKDSGKRLRLRGQNLHGEDPKSLQVDADIVNEGIIDGNDDLHAIINEKNEISLEEAVDILDRDELYINQFIRFRSHEEEAKTQYARVVGDIIRDSSGEIISAKHQKLVLLPEKEKSRKMSIRKDNFDNLFGIKPQDFEQYLALEYGLLNPDVSLFFLCGSQGSGKTLLSYMAAVDLTLWYDNFKREARGMNTQQPGGQYKKIILLKPNEILGGNKRDLGFLPGTLYEKLKPHLAPYIDSHNESELSELFPFEDMLKHPKFKNDFGAPREKEIQNKKINGGHLNPKSEIVEVTYSGFMRGRSFANTLLLIDEAQNFTPYEVKTISERMGIGSKCIIMGDPAQVDNPDCSREINGLTHSIQHYIAKPYSAIIRLSRNYRSQMSEDATEWKVYSS